MISHTLLHYEHGSLEAAAQDMIVGVLDTGVWPESKSFDNSGMTDVPARWRCRCESAADFDPKTHCNKKLIGDSFYTREAAAQDMIVGVLDTGVWLESKSFDNSGVTDVPARWRCRCESAADFDPKTHYNKKLIGASFYTRGSRMASGRILAGESDSPRD
ncbi:PREDICTED: subtilisin-like protease SBT3.15 [Ipomoea nil]|uniref:subtilisin-like protease SBT3.15 n=1 Tax=Ipomoea nil TaxID=35883 RepID=UPI000901F7C2|nr:PREDICTED: subtilisin-like protease SBT3.15 [Ipomoea nil]